MSTNPHDKVIEALSGIPGATIDGDRITIRPRATGRRIRLRANKNGKGYVTGYTLSIGSAEAAEAGMLDADRQPLPLEKIIDAEHGSITFRVIPDEDD